LLGSCLFSFIFQDVREVDRKPEDLPKLDPVNRNADLNMMRDKIKGLQKNPVCITESLLQILEDQI